MTCCCCCWWIVNSSIYCFQRKIKAKLSWNQTMQRKKIRHEHTHTKYEYCDIDLTWRLYRSSGFFAHHTKSTHWLWLRLWTELKENESKIAWNSVSQSCNHTLAICNFVWARVRFCDVHNKRSISYFVIIIASCLRNVYFNRHTSCLCNAEIGREWVCLRFRRNETRTQIIFWWVYSSLCLWIYL